MHIKDKISEHKDRAKMLKEKYDDLVDKIKNAFYEHEDYWDKTSKQKPKTEHAVMNAAYCYAMMIAPKSQFSFDIDYTLNQAEEWRSDPKVYYDYFYIWDKTFENRFGSTKPVYLARKKNIKLLEKQCKKAWMYAVKEEKTTLGFDDWLNKSTPDEILSLFYRVYEKRIDVITDRKLYLKDIVIIYPSEPFKNFHF